MYYVYIIFCKNKNKLYCGYTNNLKRRILEHRTNNKPHSFTRNENIELVYYEAHVNEKDAKNREKFLKTGWGRNYIRRILKNYFAERK